MRPCPVHRNDSSESSIDGDFDLADAEDAREVPRVEPDQKSTFPAVDVDALEGQDRSLDVDRHRLPQAERRGAAHEVTGVAARGVRRTGRDRLRADGAR